MFKIRSKDRRLLHSLVGKAKTASDLRGDASVNLSGDALMGLRYLARRDSASSGRTRVGLPGGIVTPQRGRGSEPENVRPWFEGDDRRQIDRNATARTGHLHVRTYHDERDRTVILLADFRPSMLFGTRRTLRSIAAAEALTLLGWRTVTDGGRVGLAIASAGEPTIVRPRGGERAMTAVTGAMTMAHARASETKSAIEPPLDAILEMASTQVPAGGHLVIASALDTQGSRFQELLILLTTRITVRLVLVSDAFERIRPAGLYPYILPDGQRGAARASEAASGAAEARLAAYDRLGIMGLSLKVEDTPEAYAPLMEQIYAAP